MPKVKSRLKSPRDRPSQQSRSVVWLGDWSSEADLTCAGYTSLAHNPEIITAVNRIATLVASMTIHLKRNEDLGNIRVHNELARLVDVRPNQYMSRFNFIQWIVRTMYLEGRGNAVVLPVTDGGYLDELLPVPAVYTELVPEDMWHYHVRVNGRRYEPEDILHFALNPDPQYPWKGSGYHVALSDVANNLRQAATTERGFMGSRWKPSLIVKVDGISPQFQSKEGRQSILNDYINTAEAGAPWVIPAEQMSVEQVKPLTLKDLALADFVTLDKKTVAAILGVPPFVLGVGDFNRDAWNGFISSTIMPIAQIIEQELTRKLLLDPKLFYSFNPRSLYNYSLEEQVRAGAEMVDRMAMDRNEWRSWVSLEPREDMTELLALENFVPANRLGDQKKLKGSGPDGD